MQDIPPTYDISRYALCKQVLIDNLGVPDVINIINRLYRELIDQIILSLRSHPRAGYFIETEIVRNSTIERYCTLCRRFTTKAEYLKIKSMTWSAEWGNTGLTRWEDCYHMRCFVEIYGPTIHIFQECQAIQNKRCEELLAIVDQARYD